MNTNTETPITLLIHKRPEHTKRVLERIKKVNPVKLLVVADGPRDDTENQLCSQTRRLITDNEFSFPVKTNFASENLGLPKRFTTGLNWVFDQVPEAIILEDDIVPMPSFFKFCDILLEKFRNDDRVMEVTGRNQLGQWKQGEYDYHFSYYGGIWGWATWSSAWEEYNSSMRLWDNKIVRNRIRDTLNNKEQYNYTKRVFDQTKSGEIDSWAYRWGFARLRNNSLSAVPYKNLTKNIGFDKQATHTTDSSHGFADKNSYDISFPLNHPPFVCPDREYDKHFHELRKPNSVLKKILHRIRR